MRKRVSLLLAVGLIVGAASLGDGTALANHSGNLTIQVSAGLQGVPGESLRFLAPYTVRVHRGDTVTFDLFNAHTAALLPADTSAQDWLDENWYGPNAPYSPLQADDEPGAFVDNFDALDTPSDASCGNTGEPACDYDGRALVYSGSIFSQPPPGEGQELPESMPFTTTIDAQQGDRIWVVNLVFPGERMKIVVVPNNEPATTQAEIDTARAALLAADQEWADAMHAKMLAKRTSHVGQDGTRVWDAWAGMDSEHASLNQFYPRKLSVKKGQKIRWHFSQIINQIHTVSLSVPAIFGLPQEFFGTFECDSPDAADTPAPPPPSPEAEPECPAGTTREFEFGQFLTGAGNNTWTGMDDVEHTGIQGADLQGLTPPLRGKDPFTVKMNKTTGKRPLQYVCFIHERMFGKIAVKS
ncbi:MAG: hypothetical protein M3323_07860 [Actinomycetota bacterium]|nr:hypothetical protein [Actinomycetota bacterium]